MTKATKLFTAALSVLAVGAIAAEWNFDAADALRSLRGEAVLEGTGSWSPDGGIVGGAWYFNGRDDFLRLQLSDDLLPNEEMTLAFWVRPEADSEVWQLVRQPQRDVGFTGGNGFGWYEVYTADNKQLYNGYAHPQRLKAGEWYHFALVYDQSGLEMWLDGECIGVVRPDQAPGALRHSGAPYYIGGKLWGNGGFFHGMLDEFELSNTARHEFPRVKQLKLIQKLQALAPDDPEVKQLTPESDVAAVAARVLTQSRQKAMRECFGEKAAELPFAIAIESALTRILPDDFRPGTITPELKLQSAARERENAQLLLLPYGDKPEPVTLTVPGTLIRENGKEAPFEIKTYQVNYQPLPKPSAYMYALPELPEQLIATTQMTVAADRLTPCWVEVFTPAGTAPGTYRGSLKINDFELPLTVEVWDFELPLRNVVPTLINIWERDLVSYVPEGDAEAFVDLVDAYGTMLLEHRLNPVVLAHTGLVAPWVRKAVYPDYRVENGEVIANTQYLDRLVKHFRELGLSTVAVGPHYNFDETKLGGGDWWSNIQATQPEAIWSFVQRHAAEQGWLEDAVAYAIDEPEDAVTFVNRVSGMLHRAAPELKLLLTSGGANYPDASLKNIGIWVPILHWTNRAEMLRRQAAGEPVWTYVCTGPNYPYPNLHADTPGTGIRMMMVTSARFGYDGFLHWASNFNTYKNAPMDEPNAFAAGEGTYIYADETGQPVPTVRLKYMGDGMEDWTYLYMLKEQDPAGYAEIMAELAALIPERKWDQNMKMTLKDPKEGSFHSFLSMDAFYPVYDEPERWLELRRKIAQKLAK